MSTRTRSYCMEIAVLEIAFSTTLTRLISTPGRAYAVRRRSFRQVDESWGPLNSMSRGPQFAHTKGVKNMKWAALLGCVLAAIPAIAQPNPPLVFNAANSASYGRSIAQGSLFVLYGENLGPSQLVQANSLPLPAQLGGTAIAVTSGSTMVPCPMVYSSVGAVAAILPSNVPPGTAMLTLTYNGVSTLFPLSVNVVTSSAGIYTLGSSGLGPGIFTAAGGSVNTFAAPAKSGEIVTAWGTGLGPVGGPDNVIPSTFPNFPGVEVFVGTQAAKVIYAGRSGCCVGLDQISFEIPAGVTGCYVPVAVRSGGTLSNFVSIALASGGGPCSDTAPTVPVSVMNKASAGQPIKAAALAAGPVSVLQGLGFNEKLYLADALSKLLRVKVSQEDVAKLLHAEQTGNRRALTRAMIKYAPAWKRLSPAAKAAVQAVLNSKQEGAVAGFGQFGTPAVLSEALGGLFPSQGTCTAITTVPSWSSPVVGLDAGPSLTLSGPAGLWNLAPAKPGQYQVLFGSTPQGPNLPLGTYSITSAGGRDLNAFSVTMNVAGNVVWTNKAAINSVDRSQPLTVTWSDTTTPRYVVVGGYAFSDTAAGTFVCAEDASVGSFTIPSFILSLLPAAAGGMFISPHPLSHQVTIPGVDLAYFMDGSNESKSVVYQ